MVKVRIGNDTRDLSDATESWINQQIARRREDGQNICVQVTIQTVGLNVSLTTPGCGAGGGGGRAPSANEGEVIDLWRSRGMNDSNFTGGNLVAFLKQLQRQLG
jgi:hypothetical protein